VKGGREWLPVGEVMLALQRGEVVGVKELEARVQRIVQRELVGSRTPQQS
jgi:hypothetical protein